MFLLPSSSIHRFFETPFLVESFTHGVWASIPFAELDPAPASIQAVVEASERLSCDEALSGANDWFVRMTEVPFVTAEYAVIDVHDGVRITKAVRERLVT
jgi:hypothetical protein